MARNIREDHGGGMALGAVDKKTMPAFIPALSGKARS
jgi:hypothetical protein